MSAGFCASRYLLLSVGCCAWLCCVMPCHAAAGAVAVQPFIAMLLAADESVSRLQRLQRARAASSASISIVRAWIGVVTGRDYSKYSRSRVLREHAGVNG